jgi:hypothetical protein
VTIESFGEYWTAPPGRYGLLRTPNGPLIVADLENRLVTLICDDDLGEEVVRRMLHAGVPVIDGVPDPAAWSRLAQELREVGCEAATVEQLPDACRGCPDAVPVLVRWVGELPAVERPSGNRDWLMGSIVKALTVRHAGVDVTPVLLDLFPSAGGMLQSQVADAIATTATGAHADRILDLVEDEQYGSARCRLILALKRVAKRHPRTLSVLTRVVEDDTVAADAMHVLARLHPQQAVDVITSKLPHDDQWIARAARINLRIAVDKTARHRPASRR